MRFEGGAFVDGEQSPLGQRTPDDVQSLIRDLVALSALSNIYVTRSLNQIAEDLVGVVVRMMHADFVLLCVQGRAGTVRLLRTQHRAETESVLDELAQVIEAHDVPAGESGVTLPLPPALGSGEARASIIPIGQVGYLCAASHRGHFPEEREILLLRVAANQAETAVRSYEAQEELRRQAETIETIAQTNRLISGELDLERLVQAVTDAGTELSGARFGAFFYNVTDEQGESYTLYTLAGAPREAFDQFPLPRNTEVFAPTFSGEGVLRLDDVTQDPRYGRNPPYQGMPPGHLPVRSYLAVPVVSRSREVLGGLFFGHPEPGVFSERSEQIVVGIAAQAAVAIDNARLYEEAKDAVRVRDEFLSNAAHELKTPLTSLRGYAQLTRRRVMTGSVDREMIAQTFEELDSQSTRLAKLVEQLLDLTRLETGRLGLQCEEVDLCRLVEDVAAPLRALPPGRDLLVTAPESLVVTADRLRIEQVLTNLLENALKFSPPNTPVRVAVRDEEDRVVIAVSDQGPGVLPKDRERVFDRFYQAPSSKHSGGMGLGLSIGREIIELHGGTIHVEDAGGGGARFVVQLHKPAPGNYEHIESPLDDSGRLDRPGA